MWCSWIVYKSRKDRDGILAKVMKDPRLAQMLDPRSMPLDGKRVFSDGFRVVVSAITSGFGLYLGFRWFDQNLR